MENNLITKENLSMDALIDLFNDAYLNVNHNEKKQYYIQDRYKIWFELDKENKFILFYVLFTKDDSCSDVDFYRGLNRANKDYVMYRAFAHDNNLIEINHYLWVDGGVSKRNIMFVYKFFSTAIGGIVNKLVEGRVII
jgi:hypothetical protein